MQALQSRGRVDGVKKTFEAQGLAGWVFDRLRVWRGERVVQRKQMHLVETLSLGGKRQLMLVSCGGEQFLVGGGLENVETIVRVKAETAPNLDEICL